MNFQGKVISLGYDQILSTPEDEQECSICLKANQIEALLAVIEPLAWVTRWYSDVGDTINRDLVEAFRDDIRERLMSGCEDVPITRFDSDGDYQISLDGGSTFTDALGQDPRNGYSVLPPLLGDDGDTKRCVAANSVITYFKNAVAALQTAKDAEASASDIGAVFVGILILLGIITIGWIFAFLGAFVALLYANVTAAEWSAAFDDALWQQLLCIIVLHTEADGTFSVDDVKAIISDVEAQIDEGIAQSFFLDMFKTLWAGGMSAAAGQNLGGTLSCSCGCTADDWDIRAPETGHFGEIVERASDGSWLIAQTTGINTNGFYYIYLQKSDPAACDGCCMTIFLAPAADEFGSAGGVIGFWNCGSEINDFALGTESANETHQYAAIQPSFSYPFKIKLYVNRCG